MMSAKRGVISFLSLLVIVSTVLMLGDGKRPRTDVIVSQEYDYSSWRDIAVSGAIRWQGDLTGHAVEVRAIPMPIAPRGDKQPMSNMVLELGSKAGAVEYTIPRLSMAGVETVTTRESDPREGRIIAERVVEYRAQIEYYLIVVRPPAGWQVTPSNYRVSKEKRDMNFLLTPMK